MKREHLSGEDLLLWADGDLDVDGLSRCAEHLQDCEECRGRLAELEAGAEEYAARHRELFEVSSPSGGRERLVERLMARSEEKAATGLGESKARVYLGLAACLLVGVASFLLWQRPGARYTPNAALTPGVTVAWAAAPACASDEPVPVIDARLAHQVFQEYGIGNPEPRAYEVDYLVTPALGGALDVKNLWPQPYESAEWNARVKDALEDYLREEVCAGRLDLREAQRDLAVDWVSAYQKYFRTQRPLAEHRRFQKDEPWR
jgi:anti-sigma factor RsiW